MKWLIVLAIVVYCGMHLVALFSPRSRLARIMRPRREVKTMSRRRLVMAGLIFCSAGAFGVGVYAASRLAQIRLGWNLFDSMFMSTLAMSCLYVGGLAFLGGVGIFAAALGRPDRRRGE